MPKANEIKKGFVIESNGKTLVVKDIEVTTPGGRGGQKIYKFRCADVETGAKVEERLTSDVFLNTVEMNKHPVIYSYTDGDTCIFMDNETYEQYTFNKEDIKEELLFINEETQGMQVTIVNDKVVGLELPASVEMVIVETDPSIKGASASARSKPALFATGLSIQVPEYISSGERVKINTAEHKFMSRADK